jgi:microcystin degradation protein MlrC
MRAIMAAAQAEEMESGMLCLNVAPGFAYTDVPDAGFAVLAVAEEPSRAAVAAQRVADLAWHHRTEFSRDLLTPAEAVRQASHAADGLTILVDIGDNVGAGTPGDGTVLLAELLRQQARDALVLLCDPAAVAACVDVGVRGWITTVAGARVDRRHGDPVELTGRVRAITDGLYTNVGPMRDGVLEDQGRTAVIDVEGILVVLTERRAPMWNLQQLRSLGIEPTRLRTIVVKAAIAYRAAYVPIAARILEVDTPGIAAADVRRFDYRHLTRPIYPLDEM